jgi:hypothetical protein
VLLFRESHRSDMKKRAAEETRLTASNEPSLPAATDRPAAVARRPPEELVPKVIEALDVLTEYLGLETPNPATAKKVRGARTVSREFVVSMIALPEIGEHLGQLAEFDPERAREVLRARDALRIVGERMKIFQARLSYTIEAQWAEIVASALSTYQMANAIVEMPQHAELAPHLEILRQHLGRVNGSSKKGKRSRKRKKPVELGEE